MMIDAISNTTDAGDGGRACLCRQAPLGLWLLRTGGSAIPPSACLANFFDRNSKIALSRPNGPRRLSLHASPCEPNELLNQA